MGRSGRRVSSEANRRDRTQDFALTPPAPDHSISPESSDGFASVGTILPKEKAALLPGGLFVVLEGLSLNSRYSRETKLTLSGRIFRRNGFTGGKSRGRICGQPKAADQTLALSNFHQVVENKRVAKSYSLKGGATSSRGSSRKSRSSFPLRSGSRLP
jgi:hypothetical protein